MTVLAHEIMVAHTEMINKQCNAGDPLKTPGGSYLSSTTV